MAERYTRTSDGYLVADPNGQITQESIKNSVSTATENKPTYQKTSDGYLVKQSVGSNTDPSGAASPAAKNYLYEANKTQSEKSNPSNWERAGRTILGAAEQYLGSHLNTAASYYEGATRGSQADYERLGKLAQEQVREAHESYKSALEKAQYNMDDKDVQRAKRILDSAINEQRMYQTATTDDVKKDLADISQTFYNAADRVTEAGTQNLERAKQGTGFLGGLAVDVGSGALQMAGDIATGKVFTAPGAAVNILPIMAARTFGSGAASARNAGASYERQVAAGGASAIIEVMTEKLGDVAKLAGGGALDDVIETTIRHAANNPAGMTALRLASAFTSEAVEEIISGVADPFVKNIYDGGEALRDVRGDAWGFAKELLYEGVVGGILGLGGTARAQIAYGSISADNAKARAANDAESRLAQRGFDAKTASEQAELISKQLAGESLSAEERAEFAKWPTAQEVLQEMQKDGVKATDTKADKRPGNILAKHRATRADERIIASAANSNLGAYDQHDLDALYQAAYRQGDTATCERVLEEQARRVNNMFAKMSRGEVLDLSADEKALYEKFRTQLRNPSAREQGRPDLYERNTPPASEAVSEERAPAPTDADIPGQRLVGGISAEEASRTALENELDRQDAEMQPVQQPVPIPPQNVAVRQQSQQAQQRNPQAVPMLNQILTVDDFLATITNESTQEIIDKFHAAAENNPALVEHLLTYPTNYFASGNTKVGRALKALKAEFTNSTNNGTIGVSTIEEDTNGGEQTVQQPAATGAEETTQRSRPAAYIRGTAPGSVQEVGSEILGGGEDNDQRAGREVPLPGFVTQQDISELSDEADVIDISPEVEISAGVYPTEGTKVIIAPAIGSRAHFASQLAEKLGLRGRYFLFENPETDKAFSDGAVGFFSEDDKCIYVLVPHTAFRIKNANPVRTVVHEATHLKRNQSGVDSATIAEEAFSLSFGDEGETKLEELRRIVLDDYGYRKIYNAYKDSFLKDIRDKLSKDAALLQKVAIDFGTNSIDEIAEKTFDIHTKSRASEEVFCKLFSKDPQLIADSRLSPGEFNDLWDSMAYVARNYDLYAASELREIKDALDYLDYDNSFTDEIIYPDSAEPERSNLANESASSNRLRDGVNLDYAVRQAAAGNAESLSDRELRAVLKYAVDRASPETEGQPLIERATNLILENADNASKKARPTNWLYDRGYQGNTVGSLNNSQSQSLVNTVVNVLNALDRYGTRIASDIGSDVTDYENQFGAIVDEDGNPVELSYEPKPDTEKEDSKALVGAAAEDQAESDWDRKQKPRIIRDMERGNDVVESFGVTQENGTRRRDIPVSKDEKTTWTVNGRQVEVSGWVTPSDVDSKALSKAEDAVKAKGDEATIKDRINLLEARKKYLDSVADQTRKARADFYGSEDIEQRKADLGYMADNINQQLEQLDADMGYMTDELDTVLDEDPNSPKAIALAQALEAAQRQSDNLKTQLDALRDEYRNLRNGDPETLRNVRSQIDAITNEIRDLSRKLDGVSKRAERADWGVNKRTLFQGEIANNPIAQSRQGAMPEPNRTEPLAENGWPQSAVDRARELNKLVRSSFSHKADANNLRIDDADGGNTETVLLKKCANIIDGKGILFESSTDANQAPAYDDTDDPKHKLTKKEKKAQRDRVGEKASVKPVTPEVSQAMLHLQEDVTGILKSDTPIRHVLNLTNSLASYQAEDSDMNWITSKEINDTVKEIQDAYGMAEEDVDAKAQRMASATARLLALVSTKVERAEAGRANEFAFEEAAEKNGKEATNAFGKARYFHDSWRFNPTTQFKMIDGFDKGSNGIGYQLAKQIEDSVAKEQIMTGDVFTRYAALQNEEGAQAFAEGKSMCKVPVPGVGTITEQQAVELIKAIRTLAYQEVGDRHRLDTIAGFTFVDKNGNETSIKRADLKSSKESSFYEDMRRLEHDMLEKLSPAAKKYIEITDDILFDLGNETSKVKQQVTGVGFDKFEKGYYYPVRYRSPAHQTDYTNSYERGGLFDPFTDRTRTTGGYVYVGSAADTVDNYIRNAIYAASYADLSDKLDFMNSTALGMRGMTNAVGDNYGKSFARAFNNYTNDVAQRFDQDSSGFNQMMGKARNLLQQGALRFSVSVPIKQTASYWDAMGTLSPQALREAYRLKVTGAKGYGKGNPILDVRAVGGIDPTLSEVLNDKGYLSDLKKKSKIADAWDKAISVMDYRTVDDLYHACIIDTGLSYPDLDANSKMFKDIVTMKFQEVVLNTQPVFNANARSQAARTRNELVRMVSMFQTQQTQNYNRLVTTIGEAKAAGTQLSPIAKRTLRRTIAGQVAAVAEFSILQMIADAVLHRKKQYKDEEDDSVDAGKVIGRFLTNAVESAAGTVWLGDQAAKLAIDFVNGDTSSTSGEFRGLSLGPISSAMSAVDNVVSAADSINGAIISRDLSKLNASSIRYGITNTAQLFGVPANNVASAINSIAMYGLDAIYTLSGGKAGNRLGEDKLIKIVDSWIKGDMTVNGAKRQVNKALKKEQPENVLYNVGILEAEGAARAKKNGADDPHSGRDYLSNRLKKIGADGETPNERIVNYLLGSGLPDAEIDKAVDNYVTAYSYNALYDAARKAGMSPKATVNALDEIDTSNNGDISKSELKDYYKQHGDKQNKLVEALWGAKDYSTFIPDDSEFEKFAAHYDAVMETGVSAAKASAIVDACKNDQGSITQGAIYQYYLANPNDEEQIKALFESMGYKQNGKPKTWDWFKKNYKPK